MASFYDRILQCPPLNIVNSALDLPIYNTNSAPSGTKVVVTCQSGYMTNSNPSITLTCLANEMWDTTPICEPICEKSTLYQMLALKPIIDFQLQGPDTAKIGETHTFSCTIDKTYAYSNGQYTTGSITLTCMSSQTWNTPPDLDCKPACDPIAITNGNVNHGSVNGIGKTNADQTALVDCNDGYQLSTGLESETAMCLTTGYWDKQLTCEPICKKNDLNQLLAPVEDFDIEGSDIVPMGETVQFSCTGNKAYAYANGQFHTDSVTLKCIDSQTWNTTTDLDCKPVCDPYEIPNGNVNHGPLNEIAKVNPDKIATVNCTDGYQLSSELESETVMCLNTGDWDQHLTCEPVCRKDKLMDMLESKPITDFKIHGDDTVNVGGSVNFSCSGDNRYPYVDGHWHTGNITLTCLDSLKWNMTSDLNCKTACDHYIMQNGNVEYFQLNEIDKIDTGMNATVMCTDGYQLSSGPEKEIAECLDNGLWDKEFTCKPICRLDDLHALLTLKSITGFEIEGDNTVKTGETVKFSCKDNNTYPYTDGHWHMNNINLTCTESLTWNVTADLNCKTACDPYLISNGTVFQATTNEIGKLNPGQNVTVNCSDGHQLNSGQNNDTAMCLDNGVWSKQFTCYPICQKDALHQLIESKHVFDFEIQGVSIAKVGESVKFSCNGNHSYPYTNGLMRTENISITCIDAKTWNMTTDLNCKFACDPFLIPNGTVYNVSLNEIGKVNPGQNSTVNCSKGYQLNSGQDNETSICLDTGLWNKQFTCHPVCHRDHLEQLLQAKPLDQFGIQGDNILKVGETVNFSCKDNTYPYANGHWHSDNITVTCTDSETWNMTTDMNCKAACEPYLIPNGTVYNVSMNEIGKVNPGENITINCSNGYQLNSGQHNETFTCLDNGLWKQQFICEPICQRDVLQQLLEGKPITQFEIHGEEMMKVAETVQFSCSGNNTYPYMNGHWKTGNITLTCVDSQKWNMTTDLSCKFACDLYTIANGQVEYSALSEINKTDVGHNSTVNCTDGYQLSSGHDNETVVCMDNGLWTKKPTCEPICKKDVLNQMLKGKPVAEFEIQGEDIVKTGQSVNLTCSNNHTYPYMNGHWHTDNITLTCIDSQMWNMTSDLDCKSACDPYGILNGNVHHTSENEIGKFNVGQNVTVNCNNGYQLNSGHDNENVTCLDNGIWDEQFTCQPICRRDHLYQVLEYAADFVIQGDDIVKVGKSVNVSCSDNNTYPYVNGHWQSNNISLTCIDSETWNLTTELICKRACDPYIILNGNVQNTTLNKIGKINVDQNATVNCTNGYRLNSGHDDETVTCLDNGLWDKEFICEAVCQTDNLHQLLEIKSVGQFEIQANHTLKVGESVNFSCSGNNTYAYMNGHWNTGNISMTCIGSKTWNITTDLYCKTACDPYLIANVTVDANLNEINKTNVGDNATINCTNGHQLSFGNDNETAVCLDNGLWDKQLTCEPVCQKDSLYQRLQTISVEQFKIQGFDIVKVGGAVNISCTGNNTYAYTNGHWHMDNISLTCIDSQTWNMTSDLICKVACDPYLIPNGEVQNAPLNEIGKINASQNVTLNCSNGYQLNSGKVNETIVCLTTGNWSENFICQPVCSMTQLDQISGVLPTMATTQNVPVGYQKTVECSTNYFLATTSGDFLQSATFECTAANEWKMDPTTFSCVASCPAINVDNGNVVNDNGGLYLLSGFGIAVPNTEIQIQCDQGYQLSVPSFQSICLPSGLWSSLDIPSCDEITTIESVMTTEESTTETVATTVVDISSIVTTEKETGLSSLESTTSLAFTDTTDEYTFCVSTETTEQQTTTDEAYETTTDEAYETTTDEAYETTTDEAYETTTDEAYETTTDEAYETTTDEAYETTTDEAYETTTSTEGISDRPEETTKIYDETTRTITVANTEFEVHSITGNILTEQHEPATTLEFDETTEQEGSMQTVTEAIEPETTATASTSTETTITTVEIVQTTIETQSTTESPQTTTESQQTTSESIQTTSESPQTTSESPQITSESPQITSESPQTTAETQSTSESPQTTADSQQLTSENRETTTGTQATTESPETTTESAQTSTESQKTTSESPQTTSESPQTTSETQSTTESPRTTTETQATTESPETTTETQSTTENPQTTTESQKTTSESPQTTTESPQTTTETQSTTESPRTTTETQTTTESPQTTTDSQQLTSENPETTTETQATTENPETTTETQATTESPATTTKSQEKTTEIQATTENPETTTETQITTESPETETYKTTKSPETTTETQITTGSPEKPTETQITTGSPETPTETQITTGSAETSTESPQTTTETQSTNASPETTTETLSTTASQQMTSESPETTTETKRSTESPETTTETLSTTASPQTTTESQQMTSESPETTTETKRSTKSPETTTETLSTTASPQTTTESQQMTSESPDTTTETQATTENPGTTTKTLSTTASPQTTTVSQQMTSESRETTTETQITTGSSETPTETKTHSITESLQTTAKTWTTAEMQWTTTESPQTTTETQATTESPETTTESPATMTESPWTTTESPLTPTESPLTTTEGSLTTSESPQTTTESPGTTTKTQATTESSLTTTESPQTNNESPQMTTESLQTTTKSPQTTTESPQTPTESMQTTTESPQTTTESLQTTTKTKATIESPEMTTKSQKSTESPQTTTEGLQTTTESLHTIPESPQTTSESLQITTKTKTTTESPETTTESQKTTETPQTMVKTEATTKTPTTSYSSKTVTDSQQTTAQSLKATTSAAKGSMEPTTATESSMAPTTTIESSKAPTTVTESSKAPTTAVESSKTPTPTAESMMARTITSESSRAPTTVTASSKVTIRTAESSKAPTTTAESSMAPTTTAESSTAPTTTAESSMAPTTTAESSKETTTTAESSTALTTTAESSMAPTTTAESSKETTTTAESSKAPTTTAESSMAPTTTAESSKPPITTAESSMAPITTAESSKAPTTTAESSMAPITTAESSKAPTTTAESSKAPTTTAENSKAPTTTAESSKAPTTTAESSKAPPTTAESSKAPPTTSESSKAPTTTTSESSKGQTTTAESSKAPTTTAESSKAPTTTAETSKAPPTTSESSKAPTTTTSESSKGQTTTAESSKAPTTTAESSKAPTTTAESSMAPTTTVENSKATTTTVESSKPPTTTTESSMAPTAATESSMAPTIATESSKAPTTTAESSKAPTTATESSMVPTTTSESLMAPTIPAESSVVPTPTTKSSKATTTESTTAASTATTTITTVIPKCFHKCGDLHMLGSNGFCFWRSDKGNYSEAQNICGRHYSPLASIHGSDENERVTEYAKRTTSLFHGPRFWIGMTRNRTKGEFEFDDKSPLYLEQMELTSNGLTPVESGKDCVELVPNGKWALSYCSDEKFVICKFPVCGIACNNIHVGNGSVRTIKQDNDTGDAGYRVGDVIEVSCNKSLVPDRNQTVFRCEEGGFNGTLPKCVKPTMSCYTFTVEYGNITILHQSRNTGETGYYPGDVIEIKCVIPYVLVPWNGILTCTAIGWDKPPPTCLTTDSIGCFKYWDESDLAHCITMGLRSNAKCRNHCGELRKPGELMYYGVSGKRCCCFGSDKFAFGGVVGKHECQANCVDDPNLKCGEEAKYKSGSFRHASIRKLTENCQEVEGWVPLDEEHSIRQGCNMMATYPDHETECKNTAVLPNIFKNNTLVQSMRWFVQSQWLEKYIWVQSNITTDKCQYAFLPQYGLPKENTTKCIGTQYTRADKHYSICYKKRCEVPHCNARELQNPNILLNLTSYQIAANEQITIGCRDNDTMFASATATCLPDGHWYSLSPCRDLRRTTTTPAPSTTEPYLGPLFTFGGCHPFVNHGSSFPKYVKWIMMKNKNEPEQCARSCEKLGVDHEKKIRLTKYEAFVVAGDLCGCVEHRKMALDKQVKSNICSVPCSGNSNYTCGSNQFNSSSKVPNHATVYDFGIDKRFIVEEKANFTKQPDHEEMEPVASCDECLLDGTEECVRNEGDGGLYCVCKLQRYGTTCDFDFDQCEMYPCGEHGKCIDHILEYQCECDVGWDGTNCEISRANVSMSDPRHAAELRTQTMGCIPVIIMASIAALILLVMIMTKKNRMPSAMIQLFGLLHFIAAHVAILLFRKPQLLGITMAQCKAASAVMNIGFGVYAACLGLDGVIMSSVFMGGFVNIWEDFFVGHFEIVHAIAVMPVYVFVLIRSAVLWNTGLVTEWTCWVDVNSNDFSISGLFDPIHRSLYLTWIALNVGVMIALESSGAAIRGAFARKHPMTGDIEQRSSLRARMLRKRVKEMWWKIREFDNQWELAALDVHWFFQMFSGMIGFVAFFYGYRAVYFVQPEYYSIANILNLTMAAMILLDVLVTNRMLWAWLVRWLMRWLPLWFPFLPNQCPMTGVSRKLIKRMTKKELKLMLKEYKLELSYKYNMEKAKEARDQIGVLPAEKKRQTEEIRRNLKAMDEQEKAREEARKPESMYYDPEEVRAIVRKHGTMYKEFKVDINTCNEVPQWARDEENIRNMRIAVLWHYDPKRDPRAIAAEKRKKNKRKNKGKK